MPTSYGKLGFILIGMERSISQASTGFEADARAWAREQSRAVNLQDKRLERRALEIGYRMTFRNSKCT